ncbi:MAG: zf-HC2 domain-containing protein [Anaerolineae bacterium]|nr:zf-HC2 domain-containing protein [Anaerolineae bacterium]
MMEQHVTAWLGAYHDGELYGHRLRRVEAHLAQCESCREELETLRSLSSLLQMRPAAETRLSEERFVAQVGLRLPQQPAQSAWWRVLETGWRLIPLGTLGAWAFVQTAVIVAIVVMLVAQFDISGGLLTELRPVSTHHTWIELGLGVLGIPPDVFTQMLPVLSWVSMLGRYLMISLFLFVVMALVYLSWLASWWVRRQHQKNHI